MGDPDQSRAAGADDKHPLVLPDQVADHVDDRLRAAGARQGLHNDGIARGDLGDDVFLLGVRVEQQRVGLRRPFVGTERLDRVVPGGDGGFRPGIARQCVEDGVLKLGGIRKHAGRDVGEGRHDESRLHAEAFEVAGESAEAVNHLVGFETALVVGERYERIGIEVELEVVAEGSCEFGVQEGVAAKLHLEIAAVTPDRERAQQQRRPVTAVVVAPFDDADAEVDGVDSPGGRELDSLGGHSSGGEPRAAKGELVADQVGQQCGFARDELCEATRVGGAQLYPRARGVDEMEQRRGSANRSQFSPPARPRRLGHIASLVRRVADG